MVPCLCMDAPCYTLVNRNNICLWPNWYRQDLHNGRYVQWLLGTTGCNWCTAGVRSDPELRGVIPNAFDHIFTHIQRTENEQFLVRASYLEIYQVCACVLSFGGRG